MRRKIREAATYKSSVLRFAREMDRILQNKELPESLRRDFEGFREKLKKSWSELEHEAGQEHGRKGVGSKETLSTYQNNSIGEAMKTKSVGGKSVPASSFLVTEDPESPSTWHLQVKDETGKLDHRLMGAAWAALHNGYRGNKYEGPAKAKALAMLKKMYDDEGMAMPAESAESEVVAEYGYDDYSYSYYVPTTITSFAQLEQAEAAQEIAHDMREAVNQFQCMLNNIFFWSSADQIPDKLGAAQNLFDEFVGVMGDILTGGGEASSMAGGEVAPVEAAPLIEGDPDQLAESYAPAVTLAEEDAAANPRGPLEMDVQLIKPGWGNARDNHFYPREMLARDAHVFEGAKMYTTDHRQEEKSERTEVSQIKKIVGFTEQGAPIARVIVFDPEFAEKCRNRAKANLLEGLECSILADGKAKAGYESDGRKGKVVEAITAVSSVDWVTRAGAGGKAIALAESAEGSQEEAQPAPAASVEEAAPAEAVTIQEQEPETTPVTESVTNPVTETVPETPAAPVYLGQAEIQAALSKTNLPGQSVLKLAFGQYVSQDALNEAVQAEIKLIKETTGSGRPFGLGESAAGVVKPPASREQIEEVMDKINLSFGFGR